MMLDHEVVRLLIKRLSPNDNSKNQPYFGADLNSVSFLPTGDVSASPTTSEKPKKSEVKFLIGLDFYWLDQEGQIRPAPNAKLIFYPQYPEVRFSGFLRGCVGGPSELMSPDKRGREPGRVLFLGITASDGLIGYVADSSEPAALEILDHATYTEIGVFEQLPLYSAALRGSSREMLLRELCRIGTKGWIDSKRLTRDGKEIMYTAQNGGGLTLEAELGITPNGYSKPDFMGWEVKQFRVANLERGAGRAITLMTPEPTGGLYVTRGIEEFLLTFGHKQTDGRDRIDFCGSHRAGQRNETTGMTLVLAGFNHEESTITDPNKGLTLIDDAGTEVAVWSYTSVVKHWKRKHAQAVYVRAVQRTTPRVQYKFSPSVQLGEGAGVRTFLGAVADGTVYYDPGINMKNASTTRRPIKRRSQFRVSAKNLEHLYDTFETTDACAASVTSDS